MLASTDGWTGLVCTFGMRQNRLWQAKATHRPTKVPLHARHLAEARRAFTHMKGAVQPVIAHSPCQTVHHCTVVQRATSESVEARMALSIDRILVPAQGTCTVWHAMAHVWDGGDAVAHSKQGMRNTWQCSTHLRPLVIADGGVGVLEHLLQAPEGGVELGVHRLSQAVHRALRHSWPVSISVAYPLARCRSAAGWRMAAAPPPLCLQRWQLTQTQHQMWYVLWTMNILDGHIS